MSESSDITERIERLEKAIAELALDSDRLSRANELFLQLILLSFQCSQRSRHQCVSSLRLITSHGTFTAAASRQQVLGQIARCEMESELMTELLSNTLSKVGVTQPSSAPKCAPRTV